MATCIEYNGTAYVPLNPQPADFTACTLAIPSGQEIANSPFSLSVSDASLVGAAIVGVWGVAWAFKALFLTLHVSQQPEQD